MILRRPGAALLARTRAEAAADGVTAAVEVGDLILILGHFLDVLLGLLHVPLKYLHCQPAPC